MRFTAIALSLWLIVGATDPIAATSDSESTGMLSIVSEPAGAVAYVDGRAIGRTPVDVPRLTAGDHRLRLVKDGYLENGRIVTVTGGKAQRVQVRMTAHPAADRASTEQVVGGGGGGSKKKWIYIGAGAAAVVAAVALSGGNSAPAVGDVRASPTTGLQSSTNILFNATATDKNNDPVSFAWDFGDGATGTGPDASHIYATAGTFTVKVTASDGKASASSQTTVTIRSIAGTWRSNPVSYTLGGAPQGTLQWVFTLTQASAVLTGTLQASGAVPQLASPGTVNGLVATSSPAVTLQGSVPGWLPPTFTLNPNTDVATLTGQWIDSGSTTPITFTRQ